MRRQLPHARRGGLRHRYPRLRTLNGGTKATASGGGGARNLVGGRSNLGNDLRVRCCGFKEGEDYPSTASARPVREFATYHVE